MSKEKFDTALADLTEAQAHEGVDGEGVTKSTDHQLLEIQVFLLATLVILSLGSFLRDMMIDIRRGRF